MSDCAVPGRTVLLPHWDGVEEVEKEIAEEIGMDFRFEYSIRDVVRHYDLSKDSLSRLKRLGPVPLVGRVPEGEEAEASLRLSGSKHFRAAMPDFLVRPQAPLTINAAAIATAIATFRFAPRCGVRGEDCTVAVLDSGVDPQHLNYGSALHGVQFDVRTPSDPGGPPADELGHGSLVAHIINEIAPAAKLVSIKAINNAGTISDVLAGMYLSQVIGPADLINMSLSVSCQAQICRVCRTPGKGAANTEQLQLFFSAFQGVAPNVVIIAAAGNGYRHLAFPAALDDVLAVGAYDTTHLGPAAVSNYDRVPPQRYVLAPGGGAAPADALAQRPGHGTVTYLHGTSFATAFVTGAAALFVACDKVHGPNRDPSMSSYIHRVLAAGAYRRWHGYDPQRHGLGSLAHP